MPGAELLCQIVAMRMRFGFPLRENGAPRLSMADERLEAQKAETRLDFLSPERVPVFAPL